jgi:RNA polymerase sigma-70 factor (sigma-E family)
MTDAGDREFVEYAESRVQRLRQRAYLLCRDWHLAQDLTQVTLAKLYASWKRAAKADSIDAYATKVMLRVFLDHKRLRSSQEVVIADPAAESIQRDSAPELRITLLEALGRLSPRDRAIVVLRYWEDHSVDTVAEMVGVSPGVVKTQSMRALAQLRALLGEDISLLTG